MASKKKEMIQEKAIELLKESPEGLRFSELQRQLKRSMPEVPANTINGYTWNLHIVRDKEVHKPTRGLFKYRSAEEAEAEVVGPKLREEDFYEPFAQWISAELGECSEAAALGGSYMGKKWGTPDVIGVYRPSTRDVVKFLPQLISAEIKIDPRDPVAAFGQAIAYRLFSSVVYLVEPNTMLSEDQDRIDKAKPEVFRKLFPS